MCLFINSWPYSSFKDKFYHRHLYPHPEVPSGSCQFTYNVHSFQGQSWSATGILTRGWIFPLIEIFICSAVILMWSSFRYICKYHMKVECMTIDIILTYTLLCSGVKSSHFSQAQLTDFLNGTPNSSITY